MTTACAVDTLTDLINAFSHNDNNRCICDAILIILDAQKNYNIPDVKCNICNIKSREDPNVIFWYCPKQFNIQHPDGYGICNQCITEVPQQTVPTDKNTTSNAALFDNDCANQAECQILMQFIAVMKKYQLDELKSTQNMDTKSLTEIVDNYLHVLQHHDVQFETIFNELEEKPCDITNCTMIKRNYENRNTIDDDKNSSKINLVSNIMDKMHCYFHHCYEIGHRFKLQELNVSTRKISNDEKHGGTTILNNWMVNGNIARIRDAQIAKREKYKNVFGNSEVQTRQKYNQLFISDEKSRERFGNSYKAGFDFYYPLAGIPKARRSVTVYQKFASFKEELLQNPYVTLNIHQYNNEYEKAMIYFNSKYCKMCKNFQKNNINKRSFKIYYVLAMVIYCNYTQLQYEFSKTYRENNGKDHNNFYYWGKYLKICSIYFSSKMSEEPTNVYYHGISSKLYFQQAYEGLRSSLYVFGPLSTSASKEVAISFAGSKGTLVALTDNEDMEGKCLSLSWVSDFPAEKEYLFIQNSAKCMYQNIIEVDSGIEYVQIIEVCRILVAALKGEFDLFKDADDSMQALITTIIEDKLSAVTQTYQPFQTLNKYAKHIIDSLFERNNILIFHFWRFKKYASCISKFFLCDGYEWINLAMIRTLFPNLELIYVMGIALCSKIFENIFEYFKHCDNNDVTIRFIIYYPKISSELSIEGAMQKYSSVFRKVGAFVYEDMRENTICAIKCSKLAFVTAIFSKWNENRFIDVDGEMNDYMENCVQKRLSISKEEHSDAKETMWSAFCNDSEEVTISWPLFSKNKDSYLYKLLIHPKIDVWVRLDTINKLLPRFAAFFILWNKIYCYVR
eukprot:432865_1